MIPPTQNPTVIKGMSTLPGVTATEFSQWYAAKRAMEGEGGAAGGEGEVGLLAGWLKRGLNLIGWSSQGREKRMRME